MLDTGSRPGSDITRFLHGNQGSGRKKRGRIRWSTIRERVKNGNERGRKVWRAVTGSEDRLPKGDVGRVISRGKGPAPGS